MKTNDFWDRSAEFTIRAKVTDARVARAEQVLGYKLPRSYIDLIKSRNGGAPKNTCFPTKTPTSWAEDHVQIDGICGLGGKRGIDGELGSQYMIKEWGYPDVGVMIGECPSAGHDAIMLDYSRCGPRGEPRVIHVDVETSGKPKVTVLAKDFATFIRGLVSAERYDAAARSLDGDRQCEPRASRNM